MESRSGIVRKAGWFAVLTLWFSGSAHAYVDPGTGSMAIQFLIGGLVAAGFVLKTYYYNIKNKINSLLGRPTTSISNDAELSDSDNPPQADKQSNVS